MSSTTIPGSAASEGSLYVIPATDPEKKRLVTQYALKKRIYGWTSAVPRSVNVSSLSNVLDVAAGTCVWTIDFTNIPEVRARLKVNDHHNTTHTNPVRLYACDIETKFFPDKNLIDQLGITTFQHDVTKPFPADMLGKFDIVQISFLLLCLTEQGWTNALANCRQVLKPDGILMLNEADPVLYSTDFPPPPEDAPSHDLTASLSIQGWLGNANRIYAAFSVENGFIPDLTFRLPGMLAAAGFSIIDTHRAAAPSGKLCRTIAGGDLAEFEEFSVENLEFIFEHFAAVLMAKGKLQTPDGKKVTTQEALDAMVAEVKEGIRSEGALSLGRYIVARKDGE
ncbi:hypothetical protein NEOLEDRAFT_1098552 [Neolentinus lepideus HHB14362 ss-1]|uniref:Methyltransferase domain-containing protein n=1 Tax=Neolentinus lepideus HHB14362 ss-1 TaxID=1314782 RepID=A0A165Q4R4_9AGAM|nr:hypothetical protein NEOLEDRAFT_1098552 [Neolentinus lepideus HHB14362 ss-1]